MDVRLILRRKGKPTWEAQFQCSQATLGRAAGCTVRVPASDISRQHCRLHVEDGLVFVEDLQSVNGTFVNGARVHDAKVVRPGDRLSLGSVTFVVQYEPSPDAQERLDSEIVETVDDVEVVEDAEAFAAEEVEELNLPESGDDLNNLLSGLEDDTEDRSKKRKK